MDQDPATILQELRLAAEAAGVRATAVLPLERDVVANGIRLHLVDWGNEGAPLVVFAHGGGLHAHSWDLVCLGLRERYHCIAYDLRGHGESEWSPVQDYQIDVLADDLAGLLGVLGEQRPAVVGMSLGGLGALHYAGQHSGTMRAFVLVDVAPDHNPTGSERVRRSVDGLVTEGSLQEFISQAESRVPGRDPLLVQRNLRHRIRPRPDGRWAWKNDRRPRDDTHWEAMLQRHQELWEDVPNVHCPTLVVRGERSDIVPPDLAVKLRDAFPEADLVTIPDAGHNVQTHNPVALAGAIDAFLQAHP